MTDSQRPAATPAVIDVGGLVSPIPGDAPAGADLRADPDPNSPYRRLKAAREAARASERQQVDDPNAPGADWSKVAELASTLLAEKSKDLEVAAWLVEALLRAHGFAGLRDGLRVVRGMVDGTWGELHPAITEDGGISDRVFPLTGLNGDDREGTLIAPIRMVPLTEGPGGERWGLWHYERALDLERIADPEQKAERVAAGAATLEAFTAAVNMAGAARCRTFAADLASAREELAALSTTLDSLCGVDAPPTGNIRGVLEKYDETLQHVAGHFLVPTSNGQAHAAGAPAAGNGAVAAVGGASGPLQSREDAFRLLENVADFFRRTEPHSPLSYSLEQCVRWGRMPLPELISELVPDEGSRAALYRLTGMKPPAPPEAQA